MRHSNSAERILSTVIAAIAAPKHRGTTPARLYSIRPHSHSARLLWSVVRAFCPKSSSSSHTAANEYQQIRGEEITVGGLPRCDRNACLKSDERAGN